MNNGRQTKGRRRILFLATLAVVTLIMVFLYTYHLRMKPITALTEMGRLEDSLEVEGIIIKNETVITAPISGVVELFADSGDRVGAEQGVLVIVNEELKEAAIAQIEERNRQAKQTIEGMNQQLYDNNREIAVINGKIEEILSQISLGIVKGEYQHIPQLENDLSRLALDRHHLSYKGQGLQQQIREERQGLAADEKELRNYLQRAFWKIQTTTGGMVVWALDGWENRLTPYDFKSLTPNIIRSISKVETDYIVSGDFVQANQPLGKIVDQAPWYLGAVISRRQGRLFYPGKPLTVVFPNDSTGGYPAEVMEMQQEGQEYSVILKVEESPFFIAEMRTSPVRIVFKHHDGVIVPASAILDYDGQHGLVLQKGKDYVWIPIEVGLEQQDKVGVEDLGIDEIYLVNPQKLKGKIVFPE